MEAWKAAAVGAVSIKTLFQPLAFPPLVEVGEELEAEIMFLLKLLAEAAKDEPLRVTLSSPVAATAVAENLAEAASPALVMAVATAARVTATQIRVSAAATPALNASCLLKYLAAAMVTEGTVAMVAVEAVVIEIVATHLLSPRAQEKAALFLFLPSVVTAIVPVAQLLAVQVATTPVKHALLASAAS